MSNVNFRFDTVSEHLSVSFRADPSRASFGGLWNGGLVDGFWLVLSDGPNPQTGSQHDSAILYGDLNRGIISAFVYRGVGDSYNTPLIERIDGALDVQRNGDVTDVAFTIDASNINAYSGPHTSNDWNGISFGEQIGTWLHASFNSGIRYNQHGVLNRFLWNGWIGGDENFRHTTIIPPTPEPPKETEVPEPATLSLIALGLGAAGLRRKKVADAQ